jgi:hypothetical protein
MPKNANISDRKFNINGFICRIYKNSLILLIIQWWLNYNIFDKKSDWLVVNYNDTYKLSRVFREII